MRIMADNVEIKAALKTMHERRGPIAAERRSEQKQLMTARKALREALAKGPATVPQLAPQIGLSPADTLWHVTAMKKYGEVVEAGQDGDYPQYALVAKDDESRSQDS
jgi:hypothetical protein